MAVGTCEGDVVVLDWEKNKILHRKVFDATESPRERKSILALSWLRKNPQLLLAGSSSGKAKLYRLSDSKNLDVALEYGSQPLTEEMTSIHCNCEDRLLVTSGYTRNVNIFDIETGRAVREYRNIHGDHINICRFANTMPDVLLTCSFDNTVKLWDTRCHRQVPIHVSKSSGGNVMVCFSPDDMYYLASAVDNEVKQYQTVDGRLHLDFDIKPIHSSINYTRSYYANSGDLVVSGSSNDDVVHICCSSTGKVVDSIRMYEGRRFPNLYVQSLRGNPIEANRFGVLVCYRYSDTPYEVVDIDLNRNSAGASLELPYSISSATQLASHFLEQFHSPEFQDLELVCADGKKTCQAHKSVLLPRWKWLRENSKQIVNVDSKTCRINIVDLRYEVLRTIIAFLYSGKLIIQTTDEKFREIAERTYYACKPKRYDLSRLADLIECCFRDRLTLGNAFATLKFATLAVANRLRLICIDFISRSLLFYECSMGFEKLKRTIGENNLSLILRRKEICKQIPKPRDSPCFKGRTAHTTTQIGRYVYLLGGYYSKGTQELRCIPVFDTVALEWTLLPTYGDALNIPEKLCFHSTAAVGKTLIAFGGGLKDDFKDSQYFLDIPTMTWQQYKVAGRMPSERKRHAVATVGREMWVHGGRGRCDDGKRLLGDLYKFDLDSKRWTEISTTGNAPSPRCGHTMTYLPGLNLLVVIGGFTNYGIIEEGMVYALDIRTLIWTEVSTAGFQPPPRCCHTATLIKWEGEIRIAVFGGSTSSAYSTDSGIYLADVCILSPPAHSPSARTSEENSSTRTRSSWRWDWLACHGRIPPRFTHSSFLTFHSICGSGNKSSETGTEVKGYSSKIDASRKWEEREGRLTVWAGGNSEDFLDDMWDIDLHERKWRRTRYGVCGARPEPLLKVRPLAIPKHMKRAVMQKVLRCKPLSSALKSKSQNSSYLDEKSQDFRKRIFVDLSLSASHSVTFNVEGHHIMVSKAVLAARSKQFHTMFTSSMHESRARLIDLPDVSIQAFLFILIYIYSGDIPIGLTATTHKIWADKDITLSLSSSSSGSPFRWQLTMKLPELDPFVKAKGLGKDGADTFKIERLPSRKRKGGYQTNGKVSRKSLDPDSKLHLRHQFELGNLEPVRIHSQRDCNENVKHRFDCSKFGTEAKFRDLGPRNSFYKGMSAEIQTPPVAISKPTPMDVQDLKQVLIETVSPNVTRSLSRTKKPAIETSRKTIDPLEVLVLADRFALDDLRDLLETAISKHIRTHNVCYVLNFADYYNMRKLMASAMMHAISHYDTMSRSQAYASVNKKLKRDIIQRRAKLHRHRCKKKCE
mmetsp:Transcript_2332/g.3314  ORF Transcript_2332/g.3314 Transcript_2332/m.3314 type:complete len:1319 (+) Transcript_2332:231-4187(+)